MLWRTGTESDVGAAGMGAPGVGSIVCSPRGEPAPAEDPVDAVKRALRAEYGAPGGDERVVRLLEEIERLEAELVRAREHSASLERRLSRSVR